MEAKRSGLHLLVALVCGAVLGIAVIRAISAIVDAAPPGCDKPLGKVFSVLVLALVLSLAVRLLAARFSPPIRASIKAHKAAHAVCSGAAIILVLYAVSSPWEAARYGQYPGQIRWLQAPRYHGRTMAQWLKALATEPGRSGSPLVIIRTQVDTNSNRAQLEVPMSYDLMREHDLLAGRGSIGVVIHGFESGLPLRGTNGNILIELYGKPHGLHQLEVEFIIDESMVVRGPTQAVVFANSPASH
jgi:hypothetical protein